MAITLQKRKVTIYISSEMSSCYNKIEATAFGFELKPYAQYETAIHFSFVGKRQRTARGKVETSFPSLVVLDGWGHFDPQSMFTDPTTDAATGVTVQRGRYSMFSQEWSADFASQLDAAIARGAVVLCDFRGHNAYTPFVGPREASAAEVYKAKCAAADAAEKEAFAANNGEDLATARARGYESVYPNSDPNF